MVFGLVGLLFRVATFPGIVLNAAVQEVTDEAFGVPAGDLAGDDRSDDEAAEVAATIGEEEDVDPERAAALVAAMTAATDEVPYATLFGTVLVPFLVTSLLALAVLSVDVALLGEDTIPFYVVTWLGISFGAHAFPNEGPTRVLWRESKRTDSLLRIVGFPLVGAAKLMNLLRFLWADALWALGLYYVAFLSFGAA